MSKSRAPLLPAVPCLGAGAAHGPELQAASNWWKLLQALSHEVAAHLGLQLGAIRIKRFADGEIYVQVLESIRGCDVFLLQATCPTQTASVNDSLMELMVMVDACRCAQPSAGSTTVAPFAILSHKFFMLRDPMGCLQRAAVWQASDMTRMKVCDDADRAEEPIGTFLQ
jgi:hypothetical protein